MNVNTINSLADARRVFANTKAEAVAGGDSPEQVKGKEVGMAAQQFEAIILRQLLSPVMESMVKGESAAGGSQSGSGVYGFLLTDVMASSLSQGGGLGFSKLLQTQLMPKGQKTAAQAASVYSSGKVNTHE